MQSTAYAARAMVSTATRVGLANRISIRIEGRASWVKQLPSLIPPVPASHFPVLASGLNTLSIGIIDNNQITVPRFTFLVHPHILGCDSWVAIQRATSARDAAALNLNLE